MTGAVELGREDRELDGLVYDELGWAWLKLTRCACYPRRVPQLHLRIW
jgi:hypothetical protein